MLSCSGEFAWLNFVLMDEFAAGSFCVAAQVLFSELESGRREGAGKQGRGAARLSKLELPASAVVVCAWNYSARQ